MNKDELSILFLVSCLVFASLIAQDTNKKLQSCQKQVEIIQNEK